MNKPLNWITQWALARADSIAAALALLAAGAAAILLAGCCGGGDEVLSLRAAPAAGADGRLPGNAWSGPRGEFKLRLPAGQSVSLAIDRPDGEVMKVVSGLQRRALATCLVDPSA